MPDDRLQAAQRLYQAFAAHDARALLAVLTPGFRGVVSEGMPDGLGRAYLSAGTLIRRPSPAYQCPGHGRRVKGARDRFATLDVAAAPQGCLPMAKFPPWLLVIVKEGLARLIATPPGAMPARMVAMTLLVAVPITDTLSEPRLVT
jgi:hypothetical protein